MISLVEQQLVERVGFGSCTTLYSVAPAAAERAAQIAYGDFPDDASYVCAAVRVERVAARVPCSRRGSPRQLSARTRGGWCRGGWVWLRLACLSALAAWQCLDQLPAAGQRSLLPWLARCSLQAGRAAASCAGVEKSRGRLKRGAVPDELAHLQAKRGRPESPSSPMSR